MRTHYLNYFIKLKCAPDLLAAKLFPNVKEISETLTAFISFPRQGNLFLQVEEAPRFFVDYTKPPCYCPR